VSSEVEATRADSPVKAVGCQTIKLACSLKLRDECLNGEMYYSLEEAQIVAELWRVEYNARRPVAPWLQRFQFHSPEL
jgi:hypothetical protein